MQAHRVPLNQFLNTCARARLEYVFNFECRGGDEGGRLIAPQKRNGKDTNRRVSGRACNRQWLTSWLTLRKENRRDNVVTLRRPETVPRGGGIISVGSIAHIERAPAGNTVTKTRIIQPGPVETFREYIVYARVCCLRPSISQQRGRISRCSRHNTRLLSTERSSRNSGKLIFSG